MSGAAAHDFVRGTLGRRPSVKLWREDDWSQDMAHQKQHDKGADDVRGDVLKNGRATEDDANSDYKSKEVLTVVLPKEAGSLSE
jgi:hypothetical protein